MEILKLNLHRLLKLKSRVLHIILPALLGFLVLFGSTAKEYIHSFTGHEDTIHHSHHNGELSFENEHHHCSFLGDSLEPFHGESYFPVIDFIAVTYSHPYAEVASFFTDKESLRATLRGPPGIC
jgi:hypothetical protein